MTVREMVRTIQVEIGNTSDLLPDRAAELLNKLASLMGNCLEEIREADAAYAEVLLRFIDSAEPANRARIRAEVTPEYQRRRAARDTKELVVELTRSLKYYLRSKADEIQLSGHQR